MGRRPGREADAEQAYREAAAVGAPDALRALAGWLAGRPGREADAKQAWREAADAAGLHALAFRVFGRGTSLVSA